VLASFAVGIELAEPPLAPVVPEPPLADGVCCVVSLLGLVAAGPPEVELPPAEEPPLVCATAKELARAKAARQQVYRALHKIPPIKGRLWVALSVRSAIGPPVFLR
jgi:hypothetical protein